MLTEKEIKRLRQSVKYPRLVICAMGGVILINLISAGMDLYILHMLCKSVGASMGEAFAAGFAGNFDINGIYTGTKVRAAAMVESFYFHVVSAFVFTGIISLMRMMNRRNKALLHYIDAEEKNKLRNTP